MKPVHSMLLPLERLEGLLGKKMGFISMKTRDRSSWYRWIPFAPMRQICYQQIKHFEMAWNVLVDKRAEVFLVYEFIGQYAPALLLALAIRRKPAFLFMHGIQQLSGESSMHAVGLYLTRLYISLCGGFAVHLELTDSILPERKRMKSSRSLMIPLPHQLADCTQLQRRARTSGGSVKIGVVGMHREGKPAREIINIILKFAESCPVPVKVIFGTPFWQKEDWVNKLEVEVRDTGTVEQYEALLRELDITVCGFDREKYYFRPSGVIGDALMNGCSVVCPDFPVFRAQIETPVRVGRAYSSLEGLGEALKQAISDLEKIPSSRFDEWRRHRRIEKWVDVFSNALDSK
jgi:hypothetical protein